jgi:hypothetical protein
MTSLDTQLPDTSVCPGCGAGLRCGMVAGDAQCWCVQLPNIMPVPPAPGALSKEPENAGPAAPDTDSDTTNRLPTATPTHNETPPAASCLCPACLKKITDERLNSLA